MNRSLFFHALKLRKWSWLIYSGVSIGLSFLYFPLFPTVRAQAQALTKLMQSFPAGFMKAFGITADSYNSVAAFMTREQFSFVWLIYFIILLISYAGTALAGEIETGTLALTLALPVSRARVYLMRYLAGAAGVGFFILASVVTLIPIAWLFNDSLASRGVWVLAIFAGLWGLAIYSLAFMASAIFSQKSQVYSSVGGLLVLMYIINVFSAIETRLDKLKYMSLFHYYDANALLVQGHLEAKSILLLITISVVTFLVGLWRFSSRDLPI